MANAEPRTVTVAGSKVHSLIQGDEHGQVVVLLHGPCYAAKTWQKIGTMQALADAGFLAVAIDLPGSAGSEPNERSPDAKVKASRGTFDFACSPGKASLTVIEGVASVECKSGTRRVRQGEQVRLVDGRLEDALPVGDPLQATAWINELLLLKGADNPELTERLNDILAQIGQTKVSYLYEDEIRRLGSRAALSLLRYVESERSQTNEPARLSAARLVADLADSTVIGDLIGLLADDDPRVRVYVARALERLTGKNQGRPAADWGDDLSTCQPELEAWAAWWRQRVGE